MIIITLAFIAIITSVVLLRTRNDGKYEVKLSDVTIAVIPIFLYLIITGQVLEFGLGDLKIKIKEAYQKTISKEVSSLVVGEDLIAVGVDCTYAHENEILNENTFPSYLPFKFILIQENCEDDKNGNSSPRFWGILPVDDYKENFLNSNSKMNSTFFMERVKIKDNEDFKQLIPNFVTIDNAINLKTDKLTALKKMEKLKIEYLPVINEKKEFIGIVERSRLNSSFLIDVGDAVK
ncbi:hypothetical protein J3D55_003496 [Chryseobacterium ginsenosidimutans]|uniref:CBS domain-containing protein n=1 Tax=Chryseobacterium ginsenosidimutans TaxID=687846 RepID=UPI0021688223|nr:CBS domain-containing protein [Chryseobacterium ginsenosidimutans]MCS3870580.1 hypothetical protein [Chryseobacterium ginsenosidimutans]